MSKLTATFAEMVRRAAIRLYCPVCGAERLHRLARETALHETYQCVQCGAQQTFTVR